MAKLIAQVKGFTTSQKNAGARGLALALACIEHTFEHGDWTPLGWMIGRMEPRDNAIIRSIARECMGGVTLKTSGKQAKEQPCGVLITLGDNAGPTEKLDILRKLVADGVSFRSKTVQTELFEKTESTFVLSAYAKRLAAKMEKENISFKQLMEAVQEVKVAASKTA